MANEHLKLVFGLALRERFILKRTSNSMQSQSKHEKKRLNVFFPNNFSVWMHGSVCMHRLLIIILIPMQINYFETHASDRLRLIQFLLSASDGICNKKRLSTAVYYKRQK